MRAAAGSGAVCLAPGACSRTSPPRRGLTPLAPDHLRAPPRQDVRWCPRGADICAAPAAQCPRMRRAIGASDPRGKATTPMQTSPAPPAPDYVCAPRSRLASAPPPWAASPCLDNRFHGLYTPHQIGAAIRTSPFREQHSPPAGSSVADARTCALDRAASRPTAGPRIWRSRAKRPPRAPTTQRFCSGCSS